MRKTDGIDMVMVSKMHAVIKMVVDIVSVDDQAFSRRRWYA